MANSLILDESVLILVDVATISLQQISHRFAESQYQLVIHMLVPRR